MVQSQRVEYNGDYHQMETKKRTGINQEHEMMPLVAGEIGEIAVMKTRRE